jgi:hypothetical protein
LRSGPVHSITITVRDLVTASPPGLEYDVNAGKTVYRERPPVIWSSLCVGIYVGGITWMAVDADLSEDLWIWLLLSLMFLFFPVLLLLIPASRFLYYQIRLTPVTLRVGRREQIAVRDFDPSSVVRAQQETHLTEMERALINGAAVRTVPTGSDEPEQVEGGAGRLLGGGKKTPPDRSTVFLTTRDGTKFAVATKKPDAFLAALATVVRD